MGENACTRQSALDQLNSTLRSLVHKIPVKCERETVLQWTLRLVVIRNRNMLISDQKPLISIVLPLNIVWELIIHMLTLELDVSAAEQSAEPLMIIERQWGRGFNDEQLIKFNSVRD